MAVAFGRYMGVQNGEANQLTNAATILFQSQQESHSKSPELVLLLLCELHLCLCIRHSTSHFSSIYYNYSQLSMVGTFAVMALSKRSPY